jgi:hypothetical protein
MDDNYTNQDFVAYPVNPVLHYVSGRIVDDVGVPMGSVLITAEGSHVDAVESDEEGQYIIEGLIGGYDYCIVPTKKGCLFEPDRRCFGRLGGSRAHQDFVASCD